MSTMSTSRNEFLSNVIVTAVEGGIGYWASVRNYKYTEPPESSEYSASAIVTDLEDGKRYKLDLAAVERGLSVICAPDFQLRIDLKDGITRANATNGEWYAIDAEAADCIVQAGLLADVIYG